MKTKTLGMLLAVAGVLALGAAPLYAAVIQVPGDLSTIQEALTASQEGDVIEVAPGTYLENLAWPAKELTLRSTAGPGETVIDGSGAGAVVKVGPAVAAPVTVEGFTLLNAGPDEAVVDVGGSFTPLIVLLSNCVVENPAGRGINFVSLAGTLSIEGCEIRGNGENGLAFGGEIVILQVAGSTFRDNTELGLFSLGGGIRVVDGCTFTGNGLGGATVIALSVFGTGSVVNFTDNQVHDNRGNGLEVALTSADEATITGNEVYANNGVPDPAHPDEPVTSTGIAVSVSAVQPADFGFAAPASAAQAPRITIARNTVRDHVGANASGIFSLGGFVLVEANEVRGNRESAGIRDPERTSGGIVLEDGPEIPALNARVVNNFVHDNGPRGVYVSASLGGPLVLVNNPVANNEEAGIEPGGHVPPVIANTILWNNGDDLVNAEARYSNIEDGDPGEGNLSADPRFAGNGDLHLGAGSPCVDAGLNEAEGVPSRDVDNQARVLDGNGDGSAVVDMGADEVGPVPWGPAATAGGGEPAGGGSRSLWSALAGLLLLPLAAVLLLWMLERGRDETRRAVPPDPPAP